MSANKEYIYLEDVHKITDYSKPTCDQIKLKTRDSIYACVDINCYYAQVESRIHKIEKFPVIVGGWWDEKGIAHGIVATSNYAARSWGIKTGMSAFEASQLCPHLIMFQVDYIKYTAISKELETIVDDFSHSYEFYSKDEFFADLTGHVKSIKDCEEWSKRIKKKIWNQVGLTVNIGISTTKTYAKTIADLNKPNGQTICIDQESIERIIYPLEIDKMWGIGKRRKSKFYINSIYTIGDLANSNKKLIQKLLGPREGEIFHLMATGQEETIIVKEKMKEIQSISHMHTFPKASDKRSEIFGEVMKGINRLAYRLRGYNKESSEFHFFLGPQNLSTFSLTKRSDWTNSTADIKKIYKNMFDELYFYAKKRDLSIRKIGMYASRLRSSNILQYSIFADPEKELKKRSVDLAIDQIKNNYEFDTIISADEMIFVKGRTHFLDRSII